MVEMNSGAKGMIYGSFMLGSTELAVNASELQEVVNLPDDLKAVPLAPDYFVGVFSLRETVVPVIDMRALLKQPPNDSEDDERRDCIAIIRVGNSRMGLLFDCTSEVLRISRDQIEDFDYHDVADGEPTPVKGVISLDRGQRLVQVLEPLSFLKLPGVPLSKKQQGSDSIATQQHSRRHRSITFGASGCRYGFRIDAVSEIIPMRELEQTGLMSETCVGEIELRGTVLPVLDFSRLLDRDANAHTTEASRIIIARVNQHSIGFKVDIVEGITEYTCDDLQPLPRFEDHARVFLAGCVVQENATDICLIDHEKLYATPEVLLPAEAGSFLESDMSVSEDRDNQTYLLASLGYEFLLPVADISEIIDCPETVSPVAGAPDFIDGIFNLRRKVVTVVDMRALYDLGEGRSDLEPKLVIAKHAGGLIGLRVDGVKDIVKVTSDRLHQAPQTLLAGWSRACREDIHQVFMEDNTAFPILPLSSALGRVAPVSDEAGAQQAA